MFTQLSARVSEGVTGTNLFDLSLSQALGTAPKPTKFDFATSKLGKVIQLAGFSDPGASLILTLLTKNSF